MEHLQCFTIGHSIHPLSKFLKFLTAYNINCIVDVRGVPYLKYASQYNREFLQSKLQEKGIRYIFVGDMLGAKREAWKSGASKSGIQRIIEEIKNGAVVAIMCTDKESLNCHRFSMVSHAITLNGVIVKHILKDGTLCSNDILENRLLEKYAPNYNQGTQSPAQQDALEKAYEEHTKQLTCDSA